MLSETSWNSKCLKRKSRRIAELLLAWDQTLLEILPEHFAECSQIEPEC